MADVNIVGNVSIQTADAADQVLKLKTKVSELKDAFNNAEKGSDEQKNALIQLTKAQQDLSKANEKLSEGVKDSGGAFDILKGKIMNQVPALKGAEGGVKAFALELRALMANPIVLMLTAIVAVLGFLYEAFNNTSAGAKKTAQVWAGVEATLGKLKDVAYALVRAWGDMVLSVFSLYNAAWKLATFDFKGAKESFENAKEHFRDAGKEAKQAGDDITAALTGQAAAKAAQLKKDEQLINKDKRLLTEQEKKMNLELKESRELLMDTENKDYAAKEAAYKKVKASEEAYSAKKLELAQRDLKNKLETFQLEKDGEKNHAQELTDLRNAETDAEIQHNEVKTKLDKQYKLLHKEMNAEQAAADKEAKEKEKERITNLREFTLKDLKLKQDLVLATITDAKKKELQVVENSYQDELRTNRLGLEQKKLTQAQANQLNIDALNVANQKKIDIEKKFKEEQDKKDKEANDKKIEATRKFEDELSKIEWEIKLAGITDIREKERLQLQKDLEAKLKKAEEDYKNDFEKQGQIRILLYKQNEAAKKALEKKFAEEDTKDSDERSLKDIAFAMSNNKKKLKIELDLINQRQKAQDLAYKHELESAQGNANKIKEIERKHTQDTKANEEARIEMKKKAIEFAGKEVGAVGDALSTISKMAGEHTAAGKALAIASTTMKTIQGGVSAYMGMISEIPGPVGIVLGGIAAAGVVASGLESVKQISSVQVPGGDSVGSITNVTPPISPQPQVNTTSLNASSIQGIGNAASGGVNRAFLLDRDIKDNAERDATLSRRARLG